MDCRVIVSMQEQYSVWPAGAEIPLGWSETEVDAAPLAQCLVYIGMVWRRAAPRTVPPGHWREHAGRRLAAGKWL